MTPLRILLVDDDAVDREAVRRTLAAADLDVQLETAETAEAAVSSARATSVDCVLLDYYLPGTTGLDVLTRLRAAGVDAPVIALTGQADRQTAVEMMKAGAADYLDKGSLTADGLARSVRHAMQTAAAERERRLLLEREQAARLEAQSANRAKDEFLATLSHELRTPLNSILGWTRLLTAGTLDSAASRRALETIERNVLLQTKLIDDLLDISRIVSGKLTIERQPVSLAGVVAAAVESQRPAAAAAGLDLRYEAPPEEQPVLGEAARLQQVVTNLLSNGIKFTPAGGHVHVTLRFENGAARLTVSDNGAGIAREFLPHVFERFRQADASTTRRHGGLGLGLAIVQRLVMLHGGAVHADSSGLGSGATFTVTLPVAATGTPATAPEALQYRDLSGTSILVVDDDVDGRALIALLLERCGARVRTAGTVLEALAQVRAAAPDVVLSDIAMPGEDGCALMQQLQASGASIPAAAISACVSPEDRARALRAGFRVHLAKPVSPAELFAAVAALRANVVPMGSIE